MSVVANEIILGSSTQDNEETEEDGTVLGKKTPRSYEELVTTYRNNIQKFGFDSRTLLYPDESIHQAKLAQHCGILAKFIGSDDSLLDIGCGYGSLVRYLDGSLAKCRYYGIDIVPEFIDEAKRRYPREGVSFEQIDLEHYQEKADWCLLLGVVNSVPEPKKLVQLAWEKSKKGLVVDFNDKYKRPETMYNKFSIELQKSFLIAQNAARVEEYEDRIYGWTILAAKK